MVVQYLDVKQDNPHNYKELAWNAHIHTSKTNRYLGILFSSAPLLSHLPVLSLLIYRLSTWISGHLATDRQLETIGLDFVWKAEFSQVVWGLGVGSRKSWASESLLKSCSPDIKIWKKLFIGFLALFKSCVTLHHLPQKEKKKICKKSHDNISQNDVCFHVTTFCYYLICQRKHMLETFENCPTYTHISLPNLHR